MSVHGSTMETYRNKWVLAALVFFIAFKFFLVALLWHDRAVPPEPDDSYSYSGYIYSVIRCPQVLCNTPYVSLERPDGWHFLTYRVFWGLLAKAFAVDSVSMYHASFYIGTIMLALVLVYTLSKLTVNPKLIALTLAILALFYGGGSWHGFYWVVPSFFAAMLFFWAFALLHAKQTSKWKVWSITTTTAALLFVHPIGIYFAAVLFLYTGIRALLPGHPLRQFIVPALTMALPVLILYVPVQLYLTKTVLPYTFQSIPSDINKSPAGIAFKTQNDAPVTEHGASATYKLQAMQGWQRFADDYLDWLFPTWLGVIPYVLFLALIWRARHYRLLALYAATLLFSVISIIHPFGGRAILILWPVTFIVYAFGFWYTFQYIAERMVAHWRKATLYTVTGLTLLLFVVANTVHCILFAQHLNQRGDITFSDDFVPFVLKSTLPHEPVRVLDKTLRNYITNTEIVSRPIADPHSGTSKLILGFQPYHRTAEGPTSLDAFLTLATTLFTGKTPVTPTVTFFDPAPPPLEDEYAKMPNQQFSHVTVYIDPAYRAADVP